MTIAWVVSLTLLLSTARLLWLSPRLNISSIGREKSRDREGMAELRFEAKPESGLAYDKMALKGCMWWWWGRGFCSADMTDYHG